MRIKGPTYKGGSSQHPEDDAVGAEGLTKAVYEAIRNSPVWETSLLVIIYDEHGGFYDSVPPGPAVPPGDKPPPFQQTRNSRDFDFARLGVRVPAVVVSPRIPTGTVDNTLYDHASILATLEKWLCMEPLTERDKNANHLLHLLTQAEPRDCPTTLTDPAPGIDLELRAVEPADESLDDPLPDSGNLIGFLQVLHKADLELHSDDDETAVAARREQFGRIRTKAEARAYAQTVRTAIDAAQSEPGCED